MNKHLIPKNEFAALLQALKPAKTQKQDERNKAWFAFAEKLLVGWNGVSLSAALSPLTPGQSALVCCARFCREAEYDFLTSLTDSPLPTLASKAFVTIHAQEYLDLLQQLQLVFPGKEFPEFAEDMLSALRKQPKGYFDNMVEKFVTGKGMKRAICDYLHDYMAVHPNEFCSL